MRQLIIVTTLVFIISLFFCTCSNGDEPRGRFTPEQRVERLKDRLALTSDQADKIKQILKDSQKKFAELREESSGDRSEMRVAMLELREETDKLIEEVLTEEQRDEYERLKEERRASRGQRFRDRD